jgi:hypothetical protein
MAGSLEFIKSVTGTSVSTLDITDCFSDDYDIYAIILGKSDMSAAGGFFRYRLIDSGGSVISGAEYDNAGLRLIAASAFQESKGTNETFMTGISSGTGDLTEEGGTAITYIYQPYNSSRYTFAQTQSVNTNSSSQLQGYKYINVHKSQEQITGFHILSSPAKTFENVEISVYGVV